MKDEPTVDLKVTYDDLDLILCALYDYAAKMRASKPLTAQRARVLRHHYVLAGINGDAPARVNVQPPSAWDTEARP